MGVARSVTICDTELCFAESTIIAFSEKLCFAECTNIVFSAKHSNCRKKRCKLHKNRAVTKNSGKVLGEVRPEGPPRLTLNLSGFLVFLSCSLCFCSGRFRVRWGGATSLDSKPSLSLCFFFFCFVCFVYFALLCSCDLGFLLCFWVSCSWSWNVFSVVFFPKETQ